MRTAPRRPRSPLFLVALAPLLLGACLGDDDETTPTAIDADDGVTSDDPGDDPGDGRGDDDTGEPDNADDVDADADDDGRAGTDPDRPPAVFTPGPCPFEVEIELDVDCGTVTVPASRSVAAGSTTTIDLAVAILRTPHPDPAPDPVVFLAGGPGGTALANHGMWWFDGTDPDDHPILGSRDFILLDQRGVGYSTPSLWCAEDVAEPETPRACHDRLVADGIVLADYSTPENAADVADVRRALGLEQWNLYGSSYGTRLALAVLRDDPSGVRSVTLEGVYPPNVVPAYEEFIPGAMASLDELDRWCREQPGCADVYGDVVELLEAAMDAADAAGADSPLTSQDVFDLTHSALYSHWSAVEIPYALWVAVQGDLDLAAELLSGTESLEGLRRPSPGLRQHIVLQVEPAPDEDSSGAFHSIECREEHPFTDVAAVNAQGEQLLAEGRSPLLVDALLTAALGPIDEPCAFWDSGVAEAWEREPVVSDVPALVLSGALDPITPPAWGDVAAATLSGATVLVVPSLSHSITLEHWCVDDVLRQFLRDPDVAPDTRCLPAIERFPITMP